MPDTGTHRSLMPAQDHAAAVRRVPPRPVPLPRASAVATVGQQHRTGRDALERVLVPLRASLIHDVGSDSEVVRRAVALTLAGEHCDADREETQTLLLTLRAYLAAMLERAAVGGLPVRPGRLAAARRVLGQSLDSSASATDLVTRLSAAIRDISDLDASAQRGEEPLARRDRCAAAIAPSPGRHP